MARFYVASKFENRERVGEIIDYLQHLGHQVTYDWRYSKIRNEEQAKLDRNGVLTADFVVGVFEDKAIYKGALCELGMAIALNKKIYILGEWLEDMIFLYLPNVQKIKFIEDISE